MIRNLNYKCGVLNGVPNSCYTPRSIIQVTILGSKDVKELYGDHAVLVMLLEICVNTQPGSYLGVFWNNRAKELQRDTAEIW